MINCPTPEKSQTQKCNKIPPPPKYPPQKKTQQATVGSSKGEQIQWAQQATASGFRQVDSCTWRPNNCLASRTTGPSGSMRIDSDDRFWTPSDSLAAGTSSTNFKERAEAKLKAAQPKLNIEPQSGELFEC